MSKLGSKPIDLPRIDDKSEKTLGDLPTRIFVGMLDVGTVEEDASDEGWNAPSKLNADPAKIHAQSMMRYNQLNEKEKANFEKKMTDFCYSIQAINKFFDEDGMKKVGVYIVLDKKEQLNQPSFIATLPKIIEISEKTAQFLYKSF